MGILGSKFKWFPGSLSITLQLLPVGSLSHKRLHIYHVQDKWINIALYSIVHSIMVNPSYTCAVINRFNFVDSHHYCFVPSGQWPPAYRCSTRPNSDTYICFFTLQEAGRASENEITQKHFENYQIITSSCHGCLATKPCYSVVECSMVSSWSSSIPLSQVQWKAPSALWDTVHQRQNQSRGFCCCSSISHSKWLNCILLLWQCSVSGVGVGVHAQPTSHACMNWMNVFVSVFCSFNQV